MAATDARGIVQDHFDRANRGDRAGAAALYAPDIQFHGLAPVALDREGWLQAMAGFGGEFPDANFAIHDLSADGDRVAVRHTFHGTHQGDFQGIPPTGRRVAMDGTITYHSSDGIIVAGWLHADMLGLLQQLGAIPTPG